jgi:REP element-mobilizing transposase RayT
LFYEDSDYLQFLSILRNALQQTGCQLWGYALMSNHYHLEPYAPTRNLSELMWRVGREYSLYHNDKHGLKGHTFEGPYQAFRQRTPFFALRTLAYIHNNPVAAGLVGKPEDYRWTSCRSYLGMPGSPLAVNPWPALRLVDRNPSSARAGFKELMERGRKNPPRKRRALPTASEVNQEQFRWLLDHAKRGDGDLDGVPPDKVAIYWGHQAGIPPRAMAAALGGVPVHTVKNALYRVAQILEADPALAPRLGLP